MASRRKPRAKGIFKRGKPKFVGLSNEKPPVSKRYCVRCEAYTIFKFNPNFGHSECTVCGNRFARREK